MCFAYIGISFYRNAINTAELKARSWYFDHPRAQIFVGDSDEWRRVVLGTERFLESNVSQSESFWALPYDPLYYFLAGRKSPTRQLFVFDQAMIPQEQEEQILADLKKNRVGWVVVSDRAFSSNPALGVLGKTHCRELDRFLRQEFIPVARFGERQPASGSMDGVVIYRKKSRPDNL
jgi:hypothetical protein